MAKKHIYRVIFHNQDKIYEIYARKVQSGTLYGFVEVEDLIFGGKSTVVVDPAEERLKAEFHGVTRFSLPLHAIVRIDEVEQQGIAKITHTGGQGNIRPFPVYPPGAGPGKS